MFDYVKMELPCSVDHMHKIAAEQGLEKFNPSSNHWKYKWLNLEIHVYSEKVILVGSLHIFYNIIRGKGHQNFNDFNHSEFIDCVNYIGRWLNCNIWESKLQNMEYGVNVAIDANLILPHIVRMRKKEKSVDRRFPRGGRLIEFEYAQYYFKIYNKAAQHNLKNHLTRIEVKARKSQYLASNFGIHSLKDLKNMNVIAEMKLDLLTKLNEVLIVVIPSHYNSTNHEQLITQCSNPQYWTALRRQTSTSNNQFSRTWNKFQAFLRSEGLDKIKTKFMKLIGAKWDQLVLNTRQNLTNEDSRIAKFLHLGKAAVNTSVVHFMILVRSLMIFSKSMIRSNAP